MAPAYDRLRPILFRLDAERAHRLTLAGLDLTARLRATRWISSALAELPVRARNVWSMTQLQGRTCAEIAEHLGVSRNTVYNDIKLVMGHCQDVLARLDRD